MSQVVLSGFSRHVHLGFWSYIQLSCHAFSIYASCSALLPAAVARVGATLLLHVTRNIVPLVRLASN
jgi:hypothetical protein